MTRTTSGLSEALAQFDRTEANLGKLETLWAEIESHIPEGVSFGDSSRFDNLVRSFEGVAAAMPAIDGLSIDAVPWSLDEIAQNRLDAMEVGEIDARVHVERWIEEPGRQLSEYRFRFDQARRALVRSEIITVIAAIDEVLSDVIASDGLGSWRGRSRWDELADHAAELDRLSGNIVPGAARWNDLRRHLRFAQATDLSDIATMDWPSVKEEVEAHLYEGVDPLPVAVDDLGALVRSKPVGPIATGLDWARLSGAEFERLIFEVIRQAAGYESVDWLMRTDAPDRGRDLQAYRVVEDPLAGTRRYRVIVQCKHWTTRSVGRSDLIECVESVTLWEPPKIDELIIATSGRFSQDAVALAEKRQTERAVPVIELWPESHLETLLARRPGIAARFGLR